MCKMSSYKLTYFKYQFPYDCIFDDLLSLERDCPEECQHGGTCINGTCFCLADYLGDFCEIRRKLSILITTNLKIKYEQAIRCYSI